MPDAAVVESPFSGIVKSLPLDMMFGAPLQAAIQAQVNSAKATAQYMKDIGFDKDGKVLTIKSGYTQVLNGPDGNPIKSVSRTVEAPLLALVPIPALIIKSVDIDFELTVETAESSSSSTEMGAKVEGKVGFAFWSASFSASISHKSEQTRKTDTRARYQVKMHAEQSDPPEGFKRIIDTLMNAMLQPIDSDVAAKVALPAPAKTN